MIALNFISEYIGLQSYDEILKKQLEISDRIRGSDQIQILGMEFHPVVTLGIRADRQNDLLFSESHPLIPVVQTDRGGQATLHTPGQLVIYPMMDLKKQGIGVRDFVCICLRATSAMLKTYGIDSSTNGAPGVYTPQGKIAFLGIRLDRGVVRHGLAINVNNDTSVFGVIKSCGVTSARIDRIQDYVSSNTVDLKTVFETWIKEFERERLLLQRASDFCNLQSAEEPLSIRTNH